MNEGQEKKYVWMTTEPVGRVICKMAVPTIASMMVTSAYNLADTYFVGQMDNNSATGAVGIAFALMTIIQAGGYFFGQGSGTYIARLLGQKNTKEAEVIAVSAALMSMMTGLCISIIGSLFITPLANALGATETILPHACDYLRIILLGAPFMSVAFTINCQLRFQGNAIYAMCGIVTGALINVILDPLFIITMGLGVKGAALATIMSQFCSFCILLFSTACGGNIRFKVSKIKISAGIFKEISKGGAPSLFRQSIMGISGVCLNQTAGIYGDVAIAAMSVVTRCMQMANSALIGFGQGFQPMCGMNYGAKKIQRVRDGYWFCVRCETIVMVLISVIGLHWAPQIISLFRDDSDVITFGAQALRFQCFTFPLGGLVMVSNMLTQTIGKTWEATLLAIARHGVFFIPAVTLLAYAFGEVGIQLAQSVADVCSFTLTFILMIGVFRELKREEK